MLVGDVNKALEKVCWGKASFAEEKFFAESDGTPILRLTRTDRLVTMYHRQNHPPVCMIHVDLPTKKSNNRICSFTLVVHMIKEVYADEHFLMIVEYISQVIGYFNLSWELWPEKEKSWTEIYLTKDMPKGRRIFLTPDIPVYVWQNEKHWGDQVKA